MVITIRVDSGFRIPADELTEDVRAQLQSMFTHRNPAYAKAKLHNPWTKEPEFIRMWRRDGEDFIVPRGGVRILRRVLKEHGYRWTFKDNRSRGRSFEMPKHEPAGVGNAGDLWPHQAKVRNTVMRVENCLARAPTGSGKTTAAIAAMAELNVTTLIMVYDAGLARQWVERLESEMGIKGEDIGMIGGGKFRIRPVTIAMQQTLMKMDSEKWDEVNRYFGAFIVDEVQRAAAASFIKVIDRSTARFRVGVSADERRKDGKEFLIYDLFGDVDVEVEMEELVENGFVLDVEVRIVPTDFDAPWYRLQRMRKGRQRPDFKRLLEEMEEDARVEIAVRHAREEVAAGNQVVFFSQSRALAMRMNQEAAKAGIKSGLLLGGKENVEEYERAIAALRSQEIYWAAGTIQACGTGMDIRSVSVGIVTTPIHTNKQLVGQVRGRLCRRSPATGKERAVLYYLWDTRIFGLTAVKSLNAWNKTCRVLDGGVWVDASQWLKERRNREQRRNDDDVFSHPVD